MSYQNYAVPYQAPYYPPIPPPPVDPFRGYYADRLRALTFNSRPIIQDLSVLANGQREQNNWDGMRAVVEEIEAATLRAPPHQKLPILYLIDSISKNVGPPYTTHLFAPIIPRMYLKTYREVDGVTKAKMEEMIGLWRTSGIDGGDLYGPGVRETIERDIFGSMGYQRQALPTRDRVLTTLHATLEAKHRESAAHPWNRAISQQVNVLVQIGELLNSTQVSLPELQQIMEQLKSMAPPPAIQPPPAYPSLLQPPPPMDHPALVRTPAPNLPLFPPSIPRDPYAIPPRPAQIFVVPTPPRMPSTPVPSSATPGPSAPIPAQASTSLLSGIPANVADILRNLNTSGIKSAPRTPDRQAAKAEPKSRLEAYEDLIISLDVRLESLDLNQMYTLPTSHLPQRCKQCGVRFPEGDAKMQAHMDWHFRRNRKERESEGRGAHRRWLPRAEVSTLISPKADKQEWINVAASTEAGPSQSPTNAQSGSQQPARLTAEKVAALQRKWVRVPGDSSKAATPCPVCKESFKAEWSEEEEEWVWRNAVDINSTIYHATCRAEQMSSALAARLLATEPRARSTSRSPRGTPQPEVPRSEPSPMKRKAEEEEGEAKRVKIESGHAAAATPEAANPEDATAAARGPANVQSSAMAENEAEEQMKVEPMEESPGQQTIRVIPPTPSVTAAPVSSSPAAQAIQVIPPTPSSEVRLVEIHKESEVRVVEDDEAMSDGLRADEEDRVESKEGTEEREFEPDLEVELDPEPEAEEVA